VGPQGLTFGPDGNLYVVSFFTREVIRYNGTTGAFIDVFATVDKASTGLPMGDPEVEPIAVEFGPDGNMYVSSFSNSMVFRFNGTTGAFIDIFASGNGLDAADGFTFGPDCNLYVSSANSNQVLEFNGDTGAFVGVFADSGVLSAPGGLAFPEKCITGPVINSFNNGSKTLIKNRLNRISISDITPKKKVAVIWGFKRGNGVIGGGKCTGTELGINPWQVIAKLKANGNGSLNKKFYVPSTSATSALLQTVDLFLCSTSPVIRVILTND
jgi:WD40 repeat protein